MEIDVMLRDVSDDFLIDVARAALLLDLSVSSLAQRRSNGLPPPYVQLTPGKGGKVQYRMGAIRGLCKAHEYTNTAESSQEKLLGRRAVSAFISDPGEYGFWVEQGSQLIIDSVYGDALDFKSAFVGQDDFGLIQSSWFDALSRPWKTKEQLANFLWMYCLGNPALGSKLTRFLQEQD